MDGDRPARSSSSRSAAQGTGIPVRATITSFGPTLLSKVLGLNETQESSLGLVFHFADKAGLPLLDLKDLRAVVAYLTSATRARPSSRASAGCRTATAGVILRELIAFEDQGADEFFGEPEFDTADLLRTTADGHGVVSLLELPQLQDRPRLFSTFLMWLLADLFHDLPEVGDVDKPKLVFFFDEAHLLFDDASKAFLDAIAQTVRLIRSKGVGVFFVTQTPKDVPARRARPARQPGAARAARLHPGRREGAEGDRVDVPDVVVRPRGAADPARHRRGGRHGAVRARRADAGRVDPAAGAAVADGAGRRGACSTAIVAASPLQAEVRRAGRPRVGVRAARRQARAAAEAAPPTTAPTPARQPPRRRHGRPAHGEVGRGEGGEVPGVQAVRPLRGRGARPRDQPQRSSARRRRR